MKNNLRTKTQVFLFHKTRYQTFPKERRRLFCAYFCFIITLTFINVFLKFKWFKVQEINVKRKIYKYTITSKNGMLFKGVGTMNISEIVEIILKQMPIYILTMYLSRNLIAITDKKITLNKLSKYEGNIISERSFVKHKNEEEAKKNVDFEKVKILVAIIEKLKDYTSEENLITAYNNLKTVKIKKSPSLIISCNYGTYSTVENKIAYFLIRVMGHEFLHLSSSYYDEINKVAYSGFSQKKGLLSIGDGINEGYTELLSSRIYNKNGKPQAYKSQVKIAHLLEFFFDNPKDMEEYYFNYNLPGLIHHMEQFTKREDVIKFLLDVDNINLFSKVIWNPMPTYNSIKVQLTLYNWFVAKNNDPEKLKQFQTLICENKMISIIINKQKNKLYKESVITQQEENITAEERRPKL